MFAELPKVVLHDHLDGGLRVDTVLELAAAAGYGRLPASQADALADWFDQGNSGSLERYLQAFEHTVGVMQSEEALHRIAYEAVVDLAADGVVYAELRFAPSLHCRQGLDCHRVVRSVLGGLRQGEEETGTVTRLILSGMRQRDDSEDVARLAVALRGEGVVGFDLAGPERGYPLGHHLPACRRVREASLSLTLHAGEADGPDSIWQALQVCGAHRLGHGVHIVDDCVVRDGEIVEVGLLAGYVRDHQVPLEVCPTSNLHTVGWNPADHPVGALYRAGFAVTVNPDNRLMSRTSMSAEFALLAEHHGFTVADFQRVTERAMQAAFCPHPLRRRLLEERIRPVYRAVS